jgi:hypothetical protein
MAARTTPTGGAIGSSQSSSVEKDGGREKEDSKSSQAGVQEEEATHDKNLSNRLETGQAGTGLVVLRTLAT